MSAGEEPPPPKGLTVRQYVGAFSAMLMGFGCYAWASGREVPWGYSQTGGAVLFGVGVLGVLLSWLWLRPRSK